MAAETTIWGSALRPVPLVMPMDYAATRAQAWLGALKKAVGHLPPAAKRRLEDIALGSADTGGQASIMALAAAIFPIEVITPQISSGQEIKVYLNTPGNLRDFSRLAADSETIAMLAGILLEIDETLKAVNGAWPKSIDEAREKTDELEGYSKSLEALWQAKEFANRTNAPENSRTLRKLAQNAPDSPAIRLLLAESLLAESHFQQCVEEANKAMKLAGKYTGEHQYIWSMLRPGLRAARALAQWHLNQLALAEEDLDAAILEAGKLLPKQKSRLHDLRGALRITRGNQQGMCADFAEACRLGDCQNLARATRMGQCAKPEL